MKTATDAATAILSGKTSAAKPAAVDDATQKKRQETQKKLVEGLESAGEGAKRIFDAATNISRIAAMAEEMEATSHQIYDSINTTVGGALSSFAVQGLDVVTGGEQEWNLLSANIEDAFDNLGGGILKEIEGGTAYRLEFRRLIICGKSLSQARLAMAKANAQLAELKLRRLAAEKSAVIAQSRLDQLGDQIARDQTLAQFAFNKVLDAKRSVYLAMEAYHRAFLYFTLTDEVKAPPLPRLTDTVDTFGQVVAQLSSRLLTNNALTQPPQTMNDPEITLDDLDLLQGLKTNGGFVTWALNPDNPAFRGFGRIRLNRVRIFAEGMQTAGNIQIQISTSGVYIDKRPQGDTRQFVSEPTRKNFVYSGINQAIKFDGDIARRYENDFFNPTPFTTWTLQIERQDGKHLDLSTVTSLKIQFYGEATTINEV